MNYYHRSTKNQGITIIGFTFLQYKNLLGKQANKHTQILNLEQASNLSFSFHFTLISIVRIAFVKQTPSDTRKTTQKKYYNPKAICQCQKILKAWKKRKEKISPKKHRLFVCLLLLIHGHHFEIKLATTTTIVDIFIYISNESISFILTHRHYHHHQQHSNYIHSFIYYISGININSRKCR